VRNENKQILTKKMNLKGDDGDCGRGKKGNSFQSRIDMNMVDDALRATDAHQG